MLEVEDQNCTQKTKFRVRDNQLEIRTLDDVENEVIMVYSPEDTRNIAKWLIHATNYQS